ncbi:MAG: hypothetical protein KDC54_11665, partial [Lewinella sp.]|nr:hypothetical protein [Lewinella sp.]
VPVLTFHPLPLPGRYLDLVRMQSGELVSVLDHTSGGIDVVTIDITGPAVVTSVVPNIDVNPESVALVYKECGDRLHVLTHIAFGGSGPQTRIHEIEMLSYTMNTNDFNEFLFGIVHKF